MWLEQRAELFVRTQGCCWERSVSNSGALGNPGIEIGRVLTGSTAHTHSLNLSL
jgi:hypothetical protein